MNIESLVDELDDMIEEAWTLPLSGGKSVLDADKVKRILEDIRLKFPKEIRQAKAVVADRNKIIEDSKNEAEKIIRSAEEKAKAIVDKSEILKEIEIENYIWIVYLGLIIFSFWSNNEERKYIIFGDISAKENYRKSLVLVFSIASIIYFYFFYSSYRSYKNLDKNDTESKKYFTVINLIATTLVLIAGILFLFIAIEDEELETEISF